MVRKSATTSMACAASTRAMRYSNPGWSLAEIDRKSFVDAEKPVWDKFASTPELKALVQDIVNAK